MGLDFWIPVGVLSFASFVASQQARERRTPAGAARERAALRTLAGWTDRFRPRPDDFTPVGLRYFWAARALQALSLAYVLGYFALEWLTR